MHTPTHTSPHSLVAGYIYVYYAQVGNSSRIARFTHVENGLASTAGSQLTIWIDNAGFPTAVDGFNYHVSVCLCMIWVVVVG